MKRLSFMGPLAAQIRRGRKTETRRPVRVPEVRDRCLAPPYNPDPTETWLGHRPATDGDRLAVCEPLRRKDLAGQQEAVAVYDGDDAPVLRADAPPGTGAGNWSEWAMPWRWKVAKLPGRYCPGDAVRTVLETVTVRTVRLRAITPRDIAAEGFERDEWGWYDPLHDPEHEIPHSDPLMLWRSAWDSLYAGTRFEWELNPWVWVVRFRLDPVASRPGWSP